MYEVRDLAICLPTRIPKPSSLQAEVLGKRVVVQHIPLGGILEWSGSSLEHVPAASAVAPWATASNTTPAPSRILPPTDLGYPSSQTATPRGVHHPHSQLPGVLSQRNAGPLIPPRVAVGVLANTSLRPSTGSRYRSPNEADDSATKK